MPPALAGRFLTTGPQGSLKVEAEKGYDEPERETDLSKGRDERKE